MKQNKHIEEAMRLNNRTDLEVAIDRCEEMIAKRIMIYVPSRRVKDSIMGDVRHLVALNRTAAAVDCQRS